MVVYQNIDPSSGYVSPRARTQEQPITNSPPEAQESDFEFLNILGRGASSIVVSARHIPSNLIFALKRISNVEVWRQPLLEKRIKWEINVHRLLRHPNVVRLHTYYMTHEEVVLVLEHCERGTLLRKLKSSQTGIFDEKRTARYIRQILRGIGYLHCKGVLHRDLKLENVLIDSEGRVKIADFGLAWQDEACLMDMSSQHSPGRSSYHHSKSQENLPSSPKYKSTASCGYTYNAKKQSSNEGIYNQQRTSIGLEKAVPSEQPYNAQTGSQQCAGLFGTLDYLAPEIIIRMEYSEKSDIWAVGVMMAEMLCGKPPFYHFSEQKTIDAIVNNPPQLMSFMSSNQVFNNTDLQHSFISCHKQNSNAITAASVFNSTNNQNSTMLGVANRFSTGNHLSTECAEFIHLLLSKDPSRRPTALQLLEHSWITGHSSGLGNHGTINSTAM